MAAADDQNCFETGFICKSLTGIGKSVIVFKLDSGIYKTPLELFDSVELHESSVAVTAKYETTYVEPIKPVETTSNVKRLSEVEEEWQVVENRKKRKKRDAKAKVVEIVSKKLPSVVDKKVRDSRHVNDCEILLYSPPAMYHEALSAIRYKKTSSKQFEYSLDNRSIKNSILKLGENFVNPLIKDFMKKYQNRNSFYTGDHRYDDDRGYGQYSPRLTRDTELVNLSEEHHGKVIFYEAGGHFAAHTDTKQGTDHIATVLLMIPNGHRGGILRVTDFTGQLHEISSEDISEPLLVLMAPGIMHEVTPITSGVRIVYKTELYLSSEVAELFESPVSDITDGTVQPALSSQEVIDAQLAAFGKHITKTLADATVKVGEIIAGAKTYASAYEQINTLLLNIVDRKTYPDIIKKKSVTYDIPVLTDQINTSLQEGKNDIIVPVGEFYKKKWR